MVIKWGRNGEFLACSNYPECRNTKEFKRDDQGSIQIAGASVAATDDRCGLRQMRQADGAQALALRRVPRMLRLSRLRRHQEAEGRAGPHRRQLPRMQRGRDARAAHAPRQALLRMRPLSEVQIRELGQSRRRSPARHCGAPYLVEKVTKREGARWQCAKEGCDYRAPVAEPPRRPMQRSRAGSCKPVRTDRQSPSLASSPLQSWGRIEVGVERESAKYSSSARLSRADLQSTCRRLCGHASLLR